MMDSNAIREMDMYLLAAHLEAASNYETSFEFAESFRFACLCIETFKFRIHVFVREGNSRVY